MNRKYLVKKLYYIEKKYKNKSLKQAKLHLCLLLKLLKSKNGINKKF